MKDPQIDTTLIMISISYPVDQKAFELTDVFSCSKISISKVEISWMESERPLLPPFALSSKDRSESLFGSLSIS